MKKVSELEGEYLDLWVLRALANNPNFLGHWIPEKFSSDWAKGGPIIEREAGTFEFLSNDKSFDQVSYRAEMGLTKERRYRMSGPTHLIAAMRAFVASVFGEEVDDSQTHHL